MPSADVKLAYDSRDVVGESVIWSPGQSALYWVDIVGSRIHRFDPHSGDHLEWQTPELPTSIGLCRSGGFIVGLRQRICLWEPGGEFETFAVPKTGLPSNRLNEGVVAPDGSFWVGTMLDNIGPKGEPREAKEATGSLYRVSSDGNVTRLTDLAFGITNTMVWLENGQFITADTTKNALYAFDYHAEKPALLHQRTFAPSLDRGLPDGSCRNASGTVLFNCRVAGGSAVDRKSVV